jgi:hypothetical protein
MDMALNLEDFVRVRNNSDGHIWGRYDGRDYEWPPGHYLDVHKVVATHIFGFATPEMLAGLPRERILDIRQRALLRLNWIPPGGTLEQGMARLKAITIEPIPPFPNLRILRKQDPNLAPEIEVTGDPEQLAQQVAPALAQPSPEGAAAPSVDTSSDAPAVVVPDVMPRRRAK